MGKSETEGDLQCSHDPKLRQVFSPIEQSDPMQMMGQDAKPDRVNTWPRLASSECLIAGSALLLLLAAQWILSSVILATNYYGGDGKMIVSVALTAFKFGGYFDVTNLSPMQSLRTQLLPKNTWIRRFGRSLFSPKKRLPTFQP